MVKRTGPSNYQLQLLLSELQQAQTPCWKRVLEDLSRSTRERRTVNLYKIDACARDGETVVVPGKVLSVGELHKKVDVAALSFSEEARRKIVQAKGRAISIQDLWKQNPQAQKVRIVG